MITTTSLPLKASAWYDLLPPETWLPAEMSGSGRNLVGGELGPAS